jgi:hypothetical protein
MNYQPGTSTKKFTNMNYKRLILVSLVIFQMIPLFCQGFAYVYDDNGTRLTRSIFVQQQKSQAFGDSVISLKTLNSVDAIGTGVVTQVDRPLKNSDVSQLGKANIDSEGKEITTLVYPNPSKGLLKIEISNMPASSIDEMKFYDLNGMELISKRNFDSYSELDISKYNDGIYILRIKINGKLFDWKIIKGQ